MRKEKDLEILVKYWNKENFVSGSRPHYCDYATQLMFERMSGSFKNKQVLDIGCGQGRMIEYFISRTASARGIDISKANLAYAKNKNLVVLEADTRHLPFADNAFDIVFSIGVVEHFTETSLAIKEHVRVCKKGGIVVVIVPNMLTPYFIMGAIWHVVRGSVKHGLTYSAGKSYTKLQIAKLLSQAGCKDIAITPYYGSAFLKFFSGQLNKKLASVIENSFFSRNFGHLLFGLGSKNEIP